MTCGLRRCGRRLGGRADRLAAAGEREAGLEALAVRDVDRLSASLLRPQADGLWRSDLLAAAERIARGEEPLEHCVPRLEGPRRGEGGGGVRFSVFVAREAGIGEPLDALQASDGLSN